MHTLLQDMRFALRQLRHSLGFTLTAILTLALGIGATTTVFSLVDAVLLQPLPFPETDRLVVLDTLSQPRGGSGPANLPQDTSYPNFIDWRDRAKSFDSMASWQGSSFTLGVANSPARRIDGMVVAADFFRVLGVQPERGRSFTRSEEQAGSRSVILSQALAQSLFGADASAIGQTILLSEERYTIVGVMPASFRFPNAPDAQAWITPALTMEGENASGKQRGWNQLNVVARLAAGVPIERGRAELQSIQAALAQQYPDNAKQTSASVKPQLEDLTGDARQPLHLLFASVVLLLLIACANVAGLLLTRTAGRRAELALRAALGATRIQVARQLLIESLTLSLLGGLGGYALAAVALRLAPQFLPTDLPRLNELSLNPRVLLFSLAAALVTGLLFGILPAWRSSRLDPALALRDTTRSNTAGRGQQRLHGALVVGETALGLILLIGAGLLIRSFDKLLSVDPGFNAKHLVAFRVGMPPKRFRDERLLHLTDQLQQRFAALPGVQQSTYAFPMPLAGGDMNITFSIEGHPNAPGDDPAARVSLVPSNLFSALQIPLRRGRFFTTAEDGPGTPPVTIVNQAFADRFFPGQDPLGKRLVSSLSASEELKACEIVGIVGNTHRGNLTEPPTPEYYLPYGQVPIAPPLFALRVAGDPASYTDTVRAAVAQLDPTLPVYAVRTNLLTRSTAQQRFQTTLLSAFALIALLLAAIGLYAVLSYIVAQRTFELGLRMALGAQRRTVLALILKRGLILCGIGLTVGLIASAALTRYLSSILFHTPPRDALTFFATTALLLIVCAASCVIPAWRASRLDPNETLRQQ